MDNKYPEYIMKKLRQRCDLDKNDTSLDAKLSSMKPEYVFSEVCKWDGLLGGYDQQIKTRIKDIYGIELQ